MAVSAAINDCLPGGGSIASTSFRQVRIALLGRTTMTLRRRITSSSSRRHCARIGDGKSGFTAIDMVAGVRTVLGRGRLRPLDKGPFDPLRQGAASPGASFART